MDKKGFEFLKFCHFCKTKKLCKRNSFDPNIPIYHGTFICFDCDEKRHNAEQEYKRKRLNTQFGIINNGIDVRHFKK